MRFIKINMGYHVTNTHDVIEWSVVPLKCNSLIQVLSNVMTICERFPLTQKQLTCRSYYTRPLVVRKSTLSVFHHKAIWVHSCFINSLRPRHDGRHFADDTFNRIFVNENVRILIKISLKFVPKVPINNIPALVQIMAWHRPGGKPEPRMESLLTHICVTRPQWVKPSSSNLKHIFSMILVNWVEVLFIIIALKVSSSEPILQTLEMELINIMNIWSPTSCNNWFNLLRPGYRYKFQWTESLLVQEMYCNLLDAKSLSEPTVNCKLDP